MCFKFRMLIFFSVLNGVIGSLETSIEIQPLLEHKNEVESFEDTKKVDNLYAAINEELINVNNSFANSEMYTTTSSESDKGAIKIDLKSLCSNQTTSVCSENETLGQSLIENDSIGCLSEDSTIIFKNHLCLKCLELEVHFPVDMIKYKQKNQIKNVFPMLLLYITFINGLVYTPLYYFPLELVGKKFIKSRGKFMYFTGVVLTIFLYTLGFCIPSGQHHVIQALFPNVFSTIIPSVLLRSTLSTLSYVDWIFLRHPCCSRSDSWFVPAVKYKKTFYVLIFFCMFIFVFESWLITTYLPFLSIDAMGEGK